MEGGFGIVMDASGNAYVTGYTESSNFPTASPVQASLDGGRDAFVTELNAMGTVLVYSTYLGGNGLEQGFGIAVDASGDAYVTGNTNSSNFPTASPVQGALGGTSDAFVTKLNAAGSALIYSTYLGGSDAEEGSIVAVDPSGNAYVTGFTASSNFPTASPVQGALSGVSDAFVTKLNAAGTALVYSTYLGGNGLDKGHGIAVDGWGNAYVVGETISSNFPTANPMQGTSGGGGDAFAAKISAFPSAELPRTGQTTCYDSAGAVIACAGTGQDGEIQAGVPWPIPRFTDNGDGTVTDNLTGLMWTKDGNAPGPAVCSPATTKTWQEALDYVACLNTNSYLGYTDWRLPNVNELRSMVHAGQSNSSTWLNTQGFNNVQSSYYWSSTSRANGTDYAWIVYMWSGYMFTSNKSNYYHYVWSVRSGQAGAFGPSLIQLPRTGQTTCYDSAGAVIACVATGQDGEIQAGVTWPIPRFTDNGDATITDNLTGLMWTQDGNAPGPAACSPATTKTWQGALDYVACLNTNSYLGYTDWRLPNSNELMSLVNRGQGYTAAWLNTEGFNYVQPNVYWSSTSYTTGTNNVWGVAVSFGSMYFYNRSNSSSDVWPVRSGQVGAIGSTEICDGIDNDLDGLIDEGFTDTDSDGQADCVDSDDDNDGYTDTAEQAAGSDPLNAASSPEVCDGLDNDLDGQIDEGLLNTYYRDADGDAYGNSAITTQACTQPSGYVSNNTDCNDSNASVKPGATEVCNGIDDNCNGQVDEGVKNTYYRDADNDTYGNSTNTTQACTMPSGYISNSSDCNDGSSSVHPGATESCNNIDDNCDGRIDEGCPGVEVCDGIDNDLDGQVDEDFPTGNTSCGSNVNVTPDGVTFTFPTVTLSGDTTVTTSGTGAPPPSGFKLGATPTYYEITTTATFTGTVEVCINYDETQFSTERSLKLFHWEGSGWKNITTSIDTVANIICGETTSFSPFIVAQELSTAVTLQNISAHLDINQVILTWSTSFELNNEGFIILRAESPGGPFTPITQGMIPAMGGSGKATYTFTDSNIEQGKTYYYQLQDIDSRGRVTSHRFLPVTVAFARAGEPSQRSTNHEDITARNQQKTDAAVDKGSVENRLYEFSKPTAWISVVESNNEIISAGLETKPAEDEMAENRISAGAPSPYDEKFQQGIELQRQTSPETLSDVRGHEGETQHPVSGSSSFSVSIEDDKGNIIMVRRLEDTANTSTPASDIEISEESGRMVLTWQGQGKARGFILYRTEKGKDNYTPISNLIPYFGRDDKGIFLYRFTDNTTKLGIKYEYRLERVSPEFKMGRRD